MKENYTREQQRYSETITNCFKLLNMPIKTTKSELKNINLLKNTEMKNDKPNSTTIQLYLDILSEINKSENNAQELNCIRKNLSLELPNLVSDFENKNKFDNSNKNSQLFLFKISKILIRSSIEHYMYLREILNGPFESLTNHFGKGTCKSNIKDYHELLNGDIEETDKWMCIFDNNLTEILQESFIDFSNNVNTHNVYLSGGHTLLV